MFCCHVCGAMEARQVLVDEVFMIDGKHVLVEGILANVCTRCGEATFSRRTTERIRRMVPGKRTRCALWLWTSLPHAVE